MQASGLGWEEVDLGQLVPGVPQFIGNDATLAGLAEARRFYPDHTLLYLVVEAGWPPHCASIPARHSPIVTPPG